MDTNKDYNEMLFKVNFHFDGFEKHSLLLTGIRSILEDSFMRARSEFVDLFNSKISMANEAYDKAYSQVIEPIYTNYIRDYFKEDFKKLNDSQRQRWGMLFDFYLDEEADIVARLSYFPETKIWIDLTMVE